MVLYTIDQIAKILQVSTETVRNYIKSGVLKKVKNMGSVRVSQKELQKFIEGE